MKLLTPRAKWPGRPTAEKNNYSKRKNFWKDFKATCQSIEQEKKAIVKPLCLVGGGEKPERAALTPSIKNAENPAKDHERIQTTYHWRPVQVRDHDQPPDDPGHTLGSYVNTLTYELDVPTLVGAKPLQVRLEPHNFSSHGSLWCYILGDGLIVCRGVVVGTCPKHHDPENGRNMKIGRLPVEARPRRGLQFAALSREAYNADGHVTYTSSLVTLSVTPDGWICGHSRGEMEGAIDLSAIRFCLNGGISLTDEVSIHTVDVGASRFVCLQGTLAPRFFVVHSKKPLAMLPESCRPRGEIPFVTSGSAPGAFHLVLVRQLRGGGIGGELMWKDGVWNHDEVHLTGMMYQVTEDAMPHSLVNSSWAPEILVVFVYEFQKFLISKFGSIEDAWYEAFDTDGSGEINFTEFSIGCKKAGYVGNATRLWASLDEDRGGSISLDELSMNFEEQAEVEERNAWHRRQTGPPLDERLEELEAEHPQEMPEGTMLPGMADQ